MEEEQSFVSVKLKDLEATVERQGEQINLLSQQINMMRQRVNQSIAVLNAHTIKLQEMEKEPVELESDYAN